MLKTMLATKPRKASIAFRRLSSNVVVVTLCHRRPRVGEAVQGYLVRDRLGLGFGYLECGDVLLRVWIWLALWN